jgi:RNA polymerase sigma factor (sigma-70 family)
VDRRGQFEQLYLEHGGAVRSFARRRTTAADADDLVAEVCLAAWRRLDEIPADALPWLLRVARGVLSNSRRRDGRQAALIEKMLMEQTPGPNEDAGELDPAVVRAFASLGDSDQELLLLVAWEKLTPSQIAQTVGATRGTVAVRLYRARRRLQVALAAEERARRPTQDHVPEIGVSP